MATSMEPPTLDDLVKELHISPALLKKRCSDEHLKSISFFLDWRAVAPHLGLSDMDIKEIDHDKRSEPEKRLVTLQKWKKKFGFQTTFKNLVKILLKLDNADDAEKVCHVLQPPVHTGESSDSDSATLSDQLDSSLATTQRSKQLPTTPRRHRPVTIMYMPPMTVVEVANSTLESLEQSIENEFSDSGVEDNDTAEIDRKRGSRSEEQLLKRAERELLLKLQKEEESKPKPYNPRHKKKQKHVQEPQGIVATPQNTHLQPCGDLLFDPEYGVFTAKSDYMFIASAGSERPAGTKFADKPSDTIQAQRALKTHGHLPPTVITIPEGMEVDLVIVSSLTRKNPRHELVSLNLDLPLRERSKDYYLQEIEKFLKECKKPGATIWYTGHSEMGTGNWCFKDGTISFQEIFDLYRAHFSGKYLEIVSDCCYSGKWVHTCAEALDNMGIPPCGHKAREQGVMISIYASCQPDERAGDPCYSIKGVEFSEKDQCTYHYNWRMTKRQKMSLGKFTKLVCCQGPEDPCPAESAFENWKWVDAVRGTIYKNCKIVRCTVRTKSVWYYILLSSGDKKHRDQFRDQLLTGQINVADWGHILASGSGKNPPQDIEDKIQEWTQIAT